MFQPVLEQDLNYILENFARIEINDFFDNVFFNEPLPECPDYVPATHVGDDRYFNLKDNLAITFVDDTVKNLIGGDPLTKNSLDINRLIEGVLRYLIIERPTSINNDPNSVYTFSNPEEGTWQVDQNIDINFNVQGDRLILFVDGPLVRNLNSIHRFLLTPTPGNDYSMDFDWSMGAGVINLQEGGTTPTFELKLEVPFTVDSVVDGKLYGDFGSALALELNLDIQTSLELKLVRNEFFLSKLDDLFNLACVLAVLEEKSLDPVTVTLGDFRFGFPLREGSMSSPASGDLAHAFFLWDQELQTTQSRETTEYFINYIIDRIVTEFQAVFNSDFDPPYLRETCLDQVSPLNGTVFDTALPLPNITAINEFLNDATTEQKYIVGDDPGDWENNIVGLGERVFDLTAQNNEFVQALSAAITVESARNALVSLANTTVDPAFPSILDPLYQILFLEDDGTVTLKVDPNTITDVNFDPDTEGIIPGLKVRFTEFKVTNIDQFQSLKVLQPYQSDPPEDQSPVDARFTTFHELDYGSSSMFMTFGAQVEVDNVVFDATKEGEILQDNVNVTLNLTGVNLEALFSAAVNQSDLSQVQLGEIIFFNETTHIFEIRPDAYNCTLKRIMYENGFFFPQFQVWVEEVVGPEINIDETIFNGGSTEVLNALIRMLVDTFRKQIPNLTQGPVRKEINAILEEIVVEAKKTEGCTGVEYPDFDRTGRFVNLTKSDFPSDLEFFVDVDLLGPGDLNINKVLERFLNEVKFGTLSLFNQSALFYNGLDLGSSTWNIGDIQFERLGTSDGATVSDLTLLDNRPFGYELPYTTRSELVMDGEFELSFLLSYQFDGLFLANENDDSRRVLLQGSERDQRALQETRQVQNDLRIGVRLSDLRVLLDVLTRVDIEAVLNLYAGNLLDLYYKPTDVPCLLAIFDYEGLDPDAFELEVSNLALTVRCEGICNSPMFEVLQDVGGVTDDDVSQDLTSAFNGLVTALTTLASSTDAQNYLNLAIATAKTECVGVDLEFVVPESDPEVDAASIFGYVGLGAFAGALASFAFLVPCHQARKQQLMQVAFIRLQKQGEIKDKANSLLLIERRLKPAFSHPQVPVIIKYGVPVVIIACIGMFLAANLFTVGVTVKLTAGLAGDTTRALPLLDFTLASSINKMWNAQTYWLALGIFVASGFWPHTKSLLLLFAWFTPQTILPTKRRLYLLEWLDALGKWSLIDAYVLIMLMVAFYFSITSTFVSQIDFLPDDLVTIDVVVEPGASIYLFCIATMTSLLVNHVMVAYVQKIIVSDEALEALVNGIQNPGIRPVKRSIQKKTFMVPDKRNLLYGFAPGAKLSVGALLVISTLLILAGSFVPLITFDFGGVAGFAIGFIKSDLQSTTLSSFSIALALTNGIEGTSNLIGVFFLQAIYLAFTIFTPILLLVVLAVLWFIPMTLRDQKRVFFGAEILFAWSALEVLLVSVIGALYEIEQLAQFIVKSATGEACEALTAPLLFLGLDEEDALCFNVTPSLEPTAALLFIGNIVQLFTVLIMNRYLRAAIRDRYLHETGRLELEGQCPKTNESKWPAALLLKASVKPVSRIRANDPYSLDAQVAPSSGFGDDDADDDETRSRRESPNPLFAKPNIDV